MSPPGRHVPWQSWADVKLDKKGETDKKELARVGHQVTLLPDGRVLITGGVRSFSFAPKGPDLNLDMSTRELPSAVTIYDPSTGLYQKGPKDLKHRVFHSATLVGDKVFLHGGLGFENSKPITQVDSISIKNLSITKEAPLVGIGSARFLHHAFAPLQGDTLLLGRIFGGHHNLSEGIVDDERVPSFKKLLSSRAPSLGRIWHTSTYIPEKGLIVVVGGLELQEKSKTKKEWVASRKIILFSIKDRTFSIQELAKGHEGRFGHAAVWDKESQSLILFGGMTMRGSQLVLLSQDLYLSGLSSKSTNKLITCSLNTASKRAFHVAQVFSGKEKKILIFGGTNQLKEASSTNLSEKMPSLIIKLNRDQTKGSCQLGYEKIGHAVSFNVPSRDTAQLWPQVVTLETGEILSIGGASSLETIDSKRIFGTGTAATYFSPHHANELHLLKPRKESKKEKPPEPKEHHQPDVPTQVDAPSASSDAGDTDQPHENREYNGDNDSYKEQDGGEFEDTKEHQNEGKHRKDNDIPEPGTAKLGETCSPSGTASDRCAKNLLCHKSICVMLCSINSPPPGNCRSATPICEKLPGEPSKGFCRKKKAGDPCSFTDPNSCGLGLLCKGSTPKDSKCYKKCTSNSNCSRGETCLKAASKDPSMICAVPRKEGETCHNGSLFCGPGLQCHTDSSNLRNPTLCYRMCKRDSDCKTTGTRCLKVTKISSLCLVPKKEYEACNETFNDCKAGSVCHSGYCFKKCVTNTTCGGGKRCLSFGFYKLCVNLCLSTKGVAYNRSCPTHFYCSVQRAGSGRVEHCLPRPKWGHGLKKELYVCDKTAECQTGLVCLDRRCTKACHPSNAPTNIPKVPCNNGRFCREAKSKEQMNPYGGFCATLKKNLNQFCNQTNEACTKGNACINICHKICAPKNPNFCGSEKKCVLLSGKYVCVNECAEQSAKNSPFSDKRCPVGTYCALSPRKQFYGCWPLAGKKEIGAITVQGKACKLPSFRTYVSSCDAYSKQLACVFYNGLTCQKACDPRLTGHCPRGASCVGDKYSFLGGYCKK